MSGKSAATLAPWTGEGLPPAGTSCEVLVEGNDDWYRQKINYIGSGMVVFQGQETAEFSVPLRSCSFRPIRTPEQIAAEEREKAIDQIVKDSMTGLMFTAKHISRDHAIALYNAGYRPSAKP